MAMSRFSGGSSFMRLPAMMISPAVTRSRPAIMRKVVVLPQPEGPSRQTTSPAATERSASLTATKSPNFLVILRASIVDIPSLSLDGAEGDAAQQVVLQEEGHQEDGDEEQGLDRRQQAPQDADAAARHRLVHGDRHGAGIDAGEQQREQELVPGEDQAEDEGRGKARQHLRQADLQEHLDLARPVDAGRVFDIERQLI